MPKNKIVYTLHLETSGEAGQLTNISPQPTIQKDGHETLTKGVA